MHQYGNDNPYYIIELRDLIDNFGNEREMVCATRAVNIFVGVEASVRDKMLA